MTNPLDLLGRERLAEVTVEQVVLVPPLRVLRVLARAEMRRQAEPHAAGDREVDEGTQEEERDEARHHPGEQAQDAEPAHACRHLAQHPVGEAADVLPALDQDRLGVVAAELAFRDPAHVLGIEKGQAQAAHRDPPTQAGADPAGIQALEEEGQEVAVRDPDHCGEPEDQQGDFMERPLRRHRVDHAGTYDRHEDVPGHDGEADQDHGKCRPHELAREEMDHGEQVGDGARVSPHSLGQPRPTRRSQR